MKDRAGYHCSTDSVGSREVRDQRSQSGVLAYISVEVPASRSVAACTGGIASSAGLAVRVGAGLYKTIHGVGTKEVEHDW